MFFDVDLTKVVILGQSTWGSKMACSRTNSKRARNMQMSARCERVLRSKLRKETGHELHQRGQRVGANPSLKQSSRTLNEAWKPLEISDLPRISRLVRNPSHEFRETGPRVEVGCHGIP
jgi:hypothetical protein